MTLREKLQIEHPECIDEKWHGGCKDCPHHYGYKDMKECECDSKTVNEEICRKCWDQKYEGELTPQEKRIERLERDLIFRDLSASRYKNERDTAQKEWGKFSNYVEDHTEYWIRSWNWSDDAIDAVKGLIASRNRWRAAFIGLLFGNATAFILQLLI